MVPSGGEQQMADGEWRMANDEARMADGRWQMADGESFLWVDSEHIFRRADDSPIRRFADSLIR
jgi:hypothetical protein